MGFLFWRAITICLGLVRQNRLISKAKSERSSCWQEVHTCVSQTRKQFVSQQFPSFLLPTCLPPPLPVHLPGKVISTAKYHNHQNTCPCRDSSPARDWVLLGLSCFITSCVSQIWLSLLFVMIPTQVKKIRESWIGFHVNNGINQDGQPLDSSVWMEGKSK